MTEEKIIRDDFDNEFNEEEVRRKTSKTVEQHELDIGDLQWTIADLQKQVDALEVRIIALEP